MIIKGKAHKYGDDINTDEIIPARYLNTIDPKVLGQHCLEGLDEEFPKKVQPGDILVADKNFGCGSSREHAPIAIRGAGVAAVIAKSFARIFYRNAINIGLPILECPAGAQKIKAGDQLELDIEQGLVKNLSTNETYKTLPFPALMQKIIASGGLMNYVVKDIKSGD
jgi:3-isopropylmalate/(R)-2-methylmalate dehydratase small subunit